MMNKIRIGGIHKLSIVDDIKDSPIPWTNQRSKKFYSTYREIDTKQVIVRSKTTLDSNRYIVTLVELPQDTFYINGKNLVVEPPTETIPCNCSINILVNRGCQCGAFLKESG